MAIITQKAGIAAVKLLLIRHPAPDVEPDTCYGRLDVNLRPDGGLAIGVITERVRAHKVEIIWSSPAVRCLAPARVAAAATGARLLVDPRLQELNFGEWEGMRWTDVPRAALDRWAADPPSFAPPGGETGSALLSRVTGFMAALREEAVDCAVISHGGPLRILRALAMGEIPDLLAASPAFGSVTPLTVQTIARREVPSGSSTG